MKRTEPELLPIPSPNIEYKVPADGFVCVFATCIHKRNENGLHIYGLAFDANGDQCAFGAASVQVNPDRGINIFENSTTIPVKAGGTFIYFGGEVGVTVYSRYMRVGS